MARVFLGVGTNEGNRLENISRAARALVASGTIRLIQMAAISETAPLGNPDQPTFLNTVVEIETSLPPATLLEQLQHLERSLGRVPSPQRWGPRVIDLDILFYEDQIVQGPRLTIPHPQMHRRRFALEPLAQLAPDFVHPVLKRTISELLNACDQTSA